MNEGSHRNNRYYIGYCVLLLTSYVDHHKSQITKMRRPFFVGERDLNTFLHFSSLCKSIKKIIIQLMEALAFANLLQVLGLLAFQFIVHKSEI